MSVPVQPKSAPVNKAALGAGLLASAAYHLSSSVTAWLCLAAAAPLALAAGTGLVKDYRCAVISKRRRGPRRTTVRRGRPVGRN